jgi:MFS transporter, SP family, sugar:H+ symporter
MHVASVSKWGICPYCDLDACGKLFPVLWSSLATFIIGQSYLTMLCSLRWGVYIFFAGFVLVMTLYVHFFLIETKGVPLVSSHVVLGSSLGQTLPFALAPRLAVF